MISWTKMLNFQFLVRNIHFLNVKVTLPRPFYNYTQCCPKEMLPVLFYKVKVITSDETFKICNKTKGTLVQEHG